MVAHPTRGATRRRREQRPQGRGSHGSQPKLQCVCQGVCPAAIAGCTAPHESPLAGPLISEYWHPFVEEFCMQKQEVLRCLSLPAAPWYLSCLLRSLITLNLPANYSQETMTHYR